jgi:tetratricopeptide (TPR) repeat protein
MSEPPAALRPRSSQRMLTALVGYTRVVLILQVLAAVVALVATGVAAFQLAPLIGERDAVRLEVSTAKEEAKKLNATIAQTQSELDRLRTKIANGRQTTRFTSDAIRHFHNRRYADAVAAYDRALELDPENPWIFDLKSYSEFRLGNVDRAIDTVQKALRLAPEYTYGYSELTRYQCFAKQWTDAEASARLALARGGASATALYVDLFSHDGEFQRACGPRKKEILNAIGSKE